jgi:N-acetylglucosaminyldiphosphoundecaprenol N-acetyl-beta-D-mannosaminyltransferase
MPKILGIPVYDGDLDGAVAEVMSTCATQEPRSLCISATDAHGLVHAHDDPEFAALLRGFHRVLPDGQPSVWLGRIKGAARIRRCFGPDFFAAVMRASAKQADVGHFLCGGLPGVAEQLASACRDKFGNAHVVGTHCPPFRPLTDDELAALARAIAASGAQMVWIGISSPKQEVLAARLASLVRVHFIVTVGAAFDLHTDRAPRPPAWAESLSLAWAYRLYKEPRRLWRRYLHTVPRFIAYNAIELARGRFFE